MSDWNAISAFMASVVPWPASPQDAGYVNLHFSSVDRKNPTGPLRKGGGWPFRSVDTFVQRASWINGTSQFKDVWYCLSLQSQTKPNSKDPKKPRAHRLAANALAVKAIWIDMDVGPGKQYPTIEDALKALIAFRERHGLPGYSAMVGSGGGIHAYWISHSAMTVKEWAPFADGLRALLIQDKLVDDPGVTTDVARILRVPGTFNHKTTPPKPVQLFNLPLVMYDFPIALAVLPPLAPTSSTTAQVHKSPEHNLFAEGADLDSFKVKPSWMPPTDDSLQAGIDKHEEHLLKAEPIFRQCGFYRDALNNGGAGYDQALWMYSVLGATFMENGNAIAHAISKDHEAYSKDDTQALYDRKVADRADRGIGYPSCATIAGAGCEACKTCPLFAKGKSPLNIRPVVTATVNNLNMAAPLAQSNTARALSLPLGYDVNPDGYICEVVQNEVNGELMPPTLLQLFWSKISDPWVQSDPDCLNFTTTVDKGRIYAASIRHTDMTSMALTDALAKNKVKIFPKHKSKLEHFIMSWLTKLHEAAAAAKALPFGWYREGNHIRGFVYAGKLMREDGTEAPCGVGDPQLRNVFHPTGDIQHWFDAAKTITQQQRPELDAIIALSFSAPLTALVGKNAMTLCAYGDSGVGKTAAYSVGVSVWGHSKKGKQVSHSTFNSVMKQMGELANLPLYWDEIKDAKAQQAVYDFIYNASDGVEKGRMKADTSLQDKGTWQTQMCMAANISFTDFVMKKDPSHIAGVSRVLEYRVQKSASPVGRISQTDADVIFDKLQTSYGQMGLLYGKLLAMNHEKIALECVNTCKQVEIDMASQEPERLWVSLVGTLLVGARLANTLGAELDVPALKAFLYRVYQANRAKRDSLMAVSGVRETTEGIMTAYFAQVETNDQAMWVRGGTVGPGRPSGIDLIHGPKDTKNVAVTSAIAVRWDLQQRTLYVLKDHLVDFLMQTGVGAGTCLESLAKEYGMVYQRRVRIGAGAFLTGRATACVFPNITSNHDFAELMYKWTPLAERPTDDEPTTPGPGPDLTGLTPVDNVVAFVHGATRQ